MLEACHKDVPIQHLRNRIGEIEAEVLEAIKVVKNHRIFRFSIISFKFVPYFIGIANRFDRVPDTI